MTNPFEVLRLDPGTPADAIVRHAGRLRQQGMDDAALGEIRQAVQAVTGSSRQRLRHELLTHARPQYRWPTLDRLLALGRRSPAGRQEAEPCPALDLAEVAGLLCALAAEEWRPAPLPLAAPGATGSEDLFGLTREAAWHHLLFDPGA